MAAASTTQADVETSAMFQGESMVRPIETSNTADPCKEPLLQRDCATRKLYGRSTHESTLLAAYRRLAHSTEGDNVLEFILISGPSGTGKTVLAQVLREPVAKDVGFFISGKFDQLVRPEPYGPLVAAFTEFVQLARTDASYMEKVKGAAQNVLDREERRLLTNMVPALSEILGYDETQPPYDNGSHCSEYNVKHFVRTFQKFAKACCSLNCVVVLFLDDLQWADFSSMDLLCSLLNTGVVVVGSCRDNVAMDSPLCIKLREMEENGIAITNIGVGDLSMESVNEAVADYLQSSLEETAALSQAVYQRTHGNMFHVLEYLRFLSREGLLHFDESTGTYRCEQEKVPARTSCEQESYANHVDSIDEMMIAKLRRLPVEVQDTMKTASCIGAKFDAVMLRCALSKDLAQTMDDSLQRAVDAGIVNYDEKSKIYAFSHDRIQQASYALLALEEREHYHLMVGRNLWTRLDSEEMEKNIFVVLSQLQRGSSHVEDQTELYGIASLSLLAGRKSLKSSGFRVAAEYLEYGISLLGDDCWRDEYDLTISLHNATAEVEFVLANFERMNALLESVFSNAKSFKDKVRAYSTLVYYLGVSGERQQAIDVGFNVLRQLGESVPGSIPKKWHILRDITRTTFFLRGKSNESFLRLPLMTDPDKLASMHILNLLFLHVYMLRPDFLAFLICKMVQLSLNHGLCAVSALGFAGLATIQSGIFDDVEGGYRYARLALAILNKFQTKAYIPRVYSALYGTVMHWKRPFHFSLEPLNRAYEIGLETGDIEFAMFALNMYAYNFFHCGKPLDALEKDVEANIKVMESYKQGTALMMARPHLQFIRNLMGKCEDSLVMTGETFDERVYISRAADEGDLHNISAIHYQKLFLGYLFGDYIYAEKMAERCRNVDKVSMSSQLVPLTIFFDCMNCLALARQGTRRRKLKNRVRRQIPRFRKWGMLCPENYLSYQCLVEAEYAALVGKNDRAHVKYTQAIALSAEQAPTFVYGIANERAGHFMQRLQDDERASCYFREAYVTFKQWGAQKKAEQLMADIPVLQKIMKSSQDQEFASTASLGYRALHDG